MEELISKLYFNDDILYSENSEEERITSLLNEKEKIIKTTLNSEQTKAFHEYQELKNEQCTNDCLDAYCKGFKYAVKLFAEALKDKK